MFHREIDDAAFFRDIYLLTVFNDNRQTIRLFENILKIINYTCDNICLDEKCAYIGPLKFLPNFEKLPNH